MPVIVELRKESGDVVARAGGDGLLERLAQRADATSACLRWVDPYGDTIFNTFQAQALADELEAFLPAVRPEERASLEQLISLSLDCSRGVHLYVWCIGD